MSPDHEVDMDITSVVVGTNDIIEQKIRRKFEIIVAGASSGYFMLPIVSTQVLLGTVLGSSRIFHLYLL